MDTLLTLLRLCCMLDLPPCGYLPIPFKVPYPTVGLPSIWIPSSPCLCSDSWCQASTHTDALLTLLVHLHLTPGHRSMWTLSFPCPNIPPSTTSLTYSGYDRLYHAALPCLSLFLGSVIPNQITSTYVLLSYHIWVPTAHSKPPTPPRGCLPYLT